ncbi:MULTISPECIES: phage replisome organizer N-terminal domain-containing protein [unclassified Clostridium]|uniref:phage replisome organizer N-terminal domain-containing protein n=1 Tax=unclassified Clostridium TaxID=2614128 RepID=UPI001FA85021|nr:MULTISPECIES: phage replisome organizer N-terminal domain-containing protein [unclassified Clostridium]
MIKVRERRYVRLRVDMFEDTKFKIIDRMPERDVIHYIWARIVTLAGKINLEGNLYMSKNIPYTVDTLAIEFNRDVNQVKLALDTFIKLEMVEVTEENIYKVKNFAKHQNIKVKAKDKEEEIKKEESHLKSEESNKVNMNIDNQKLENKEKEIDNNSSEKQDEKGEKNNINDGKVDLEFVNTDVNQDNNSLQSTPILLEMKKSKKLNKRGRKDMDIKITDEEVNDDSIISMYEGDARPLGEGESVVSEWAF